MNAPLTPVRFARAGRSSLATRLRKEIDGEVLFDAATRGRYSTDASIYQIEPVGVVVPRSEEARSPRSRSRSRRASRCCRAARGTSQCGQTVGAALVIDDTKYLNHVLAVRSRRARRAVVQPGVVLDQLNA